jgi:hemerythrin
MKACPAWHEALSCWFPEMDGQHRGQLLRLEALGARARWSPDDGEVDALLLAVVADTTRHLDDEDRAIGAVAPGRVIGA